MKNTAAKIISSVLALAAALALCFSMPYMAAAEETNTETASAYVTFEDVEASVLRGNLTVLSLQENIDMISEIDYEDLKDTLLDAMNQLADAQWALSTAISMGFSNDNYHLDMIKTQWDTLDDQFEDLKDGTTEKNNNDMKRMMSNTQKQLVMAAESLYMTQKNLEVTRTALTRQAAALDRTKKEMDVRYNNGQVSSLNLAELENGIVQLNSGKATLNMNMEILSLQLKNMLGVDLGADLILKDPEIPGTDKLNKMDLEKDLASAKANSYQLYDAKKTLDDAEDDLKDVQREKAYEYYEQPGSSVRRQADHNWQSAQYTYRATERSFELSFRTLYAQVKDYAQVHEAAKSALLTEQKDYEADKIRYSYGTISQNALKTAEDDLRTAEEKVRTTGFDLASAYRQYTHAVKDGIVSSGSSGGSIN